MASEPRVHPTTLDQIIADAGISDDAAERLRQANGYEEPTPSAEGRKGRSRTRGHGSSVPPRMEMPGI